VPGGGVPREGGQQRGGVPLIGPFTGPYGFLSNFARIDIRLPDGTYPSVEHAFQASKTDDPAERAHVRAAATPAIAKQRGKKVRLRPDWETVKVSIMEALVRQKFADPALRAQLLATGEEELVEINTWNDKFWGVCKGKGQNNLGKILMKVRAEIRG
jgi:ribA/ribD-fused uncharacterized protein